jgi:hypothetical protein
MYDKLSTTEKTRIFELKSKILTFDRAKEKRVFLLLCAHLIVSLQANKKFPIKTARGISIT